jgi:hypothetical protein
LGWAWIIHLGQEYFDPLDFKTPEFGCAGPLLHPVAVAREFRGHFHPPRLVLAGSPECDLKCIGASLFWQRHHAQVYCRLGIDWKI